ncbi:hypothetical protein CEXT_389851 [Caerostris extrusa]|uniref:Uncharacterized protein n=1 Tax=Caerostris extrusa TaxID=172846 RepID=A0AAV4V9B3_CAEEX|nr:hypothetical protein CEXT_389851 [Caerostris extrusa]
MILSGNELLLCGQVHYGRSSCTLPHSPRLIQEIMGFTPDSCHGDRGRMRQKSFNETRHPSRLVFGPFFIYIFVSPDHPQPAFFRTIHSDHF